MHASPAGRSVALSKRHTGLVTWTSWQAAWQAALYGADGFYRRPEGPAGHFTTSAQGIPGTGPVLAEAVLALADRHGLSTIVEIGAGRGELLRELHGLDRTRSLQGVDVVDRPGDLPDPVDWLRSPGGPGLPAELAGLDEVLVIAHEWLDVVPCPVVVRSPMGPWRYVTVDPVTGDERADEAASGADLDWLGTHVPDHVRRAEIGRPRDTAYADLCSRVLRGLVVAVDYGHTREDRPVEGTLIGYRDGASVPPVPDGSCDLTAHVAIDSLGADRLVRQRDILHDLLGRWPLPDHDLARTDPSAYLLGLQRANVLATLTAPTGLGGFWWATTLRRSGDLG